MADTSKKTYWPHMIVGFFILGITLSFWTVRSASQMPVQKSNTFMMEYQLADIHINEILEKKAAFDKKYTIALEDVEMMTMVDNIHSNMPQPDVVKLTKGSNSFLYSVKGKDGSAIQDAKITFLLTRPHTRVDDMKVEHMMLDAQHHTAVENVVIEKPGRYTLVLKVETEDTLGYLETPAYLKPEK
jgi:hypothetical protein